MPASGASCGSVQQDAPGGDWPASPDPACGGGCLL